MMGLTPVQKRCMDFLRSFQEENGIMPSFREIGDFFDYKSISRVYYLLISLEDRGAIRRLSKKARAIEIVEANSLQAVLLNCGTYGLVRSYAGSKFVSVDAAVDTIIRERLGVAA